jgi:hypothetical protein
MFEEADGTPLADLDTGRGHIGPSLQANQVSTVSVLLRALPLRPGEYRMDIDVRDDGTFQWWRMPHYLVFTIEPSLIPSQNNYRAVPRGSVAIDFGFVVPAK